jgi:nicotinamide riboside kinase
MSPAFVVALLGAESTGKTTLTGEIRLALAARGIRAAVVGEALRDFCIEHGRTPSQDEQAAIAREQSRRIDAAADAASVVIADTTALLTAVYSEIVFADTSLYACGESAQRRCGLTLLTALDLPWQADGLQRDGAHVREPVDSLLRAALTRAGIAFHPIAGSGPARLEAALAEIDRALDRQR